MFAFAEVTLSRRFPKSMGVFDYAVPHALRERVRLGQMVSIPFRGRACEGVIIGLKDTPISGKRILSITSLLSSDPVLTGEQLHLAAWMAEYYGVSIGTLIKGMLPESPKRIVSPPPSTQDRQIPQTIDSPKVQPPTSVVWFEKAAERKRWYQNFFAMSRGTTLVLAPDIQTVEDISHMVSGSCAHEVALLHSGLSVRERYDAWQDIRTGRKTILIGTKIAVGFPYPKLSTVIIDTEEDDGHKQSDQNPRYDSRHVAEKLSKLHTAELVRLTYSPLVSTYVEVASKNWDMRNQPMFRPVEVISLLDERSKRNFSFISDRLEEQITTALNDGGRVFLYMDRRGASSSVRCSDCGTTHECKNCRRPFVVHTSGKADLLVCHYCGASQALGPCHHCGSVSYRVFGGGAQKVEREIRERFAHVDCVRMDTDSGTVTTSAPIVIGTEWAVHRLDLSAFQVVAIISADALVHLPDYRASERTLHRISRIFSFTSPAALRVIQTHVPDHPVMKAFATGDRLQWFATESAERKLLRYPPYGTLIKLIYSNPSPARLESERTRMLNSIRTQFPFFDAFLLDPLHKSTKKGHTGFIIIKAPVKVSIADISALFKILPDAWLVDRDPVSLL